MRAVRPNFKQPPKVNPEPLMPLAVLSELTDSADVIGTGPDGETWLLISVAPHLMQYLEQLQSDEREACDDPGEDPDGGPDTDEGIPDEHQRLHYEDDERSLGWPTEGAQWDSTSPDTQPETFDTLE